MQNLNVLLVQVDQAWENKDQNLKHFEGLLKHAPTCDLILLPEMFHTGFSMNASALAEKMEDSIGLNWLKRIAAEKNAAVYTSMIIVEDNAYRNRGVFVEPDGKVTVYDKRKCFGLAGEDEIYTEGNERVIVHFRGWKILLQICYDLRFPEIARNKIKDNGEPEYDLLLYVANWPERRVEHWKALIRARAIENQCYVAAVNRIGKDGKELNYSGDSAVIDILGSTEACKPFEEELKLVELKWDYLMEMRNALPFLKDM